MRAQPISLRLAPELFEELRQSADAHGMSVSKYIRQAIEARLRPVGSIDFSNRTVGWRPLPPEINVTFSNVSTGGRS